MVPKNLRSLRLRMASIQAKVQIPNDKHTGTTILMNLELFGRKRKYRNTNVQAYIGCYRIP